MQQSAFYYDEHAGQYRNSRTIDTEPWFGFISSGTAIAYHNSPMYEYLQLLKENKVAPHSYINDYYSYFSKARDGEYKYENLRVVFGGYYELYKPIVDKYNKLHNTYKKIFGKKIYYLQPLAYLLKPIMSVFERALNFLFKE